MCGRVRVKIKCGRKCLGAATAAATATLTTIVLFLKLFVWPKIHTIKKIVGERARERQSQMECFLVLLPYFVCLNQLKMLLTIIFYMLWLRFICLCIKYNMFETVRSLIFPSDIPSSSPSLCRAFSLSFSQTLSLCTHYFYFSSYTKSDLVFNVSDQRAYVHHISYQH